MDTPVFNRYQQVGTVKDFINKSYLKYSEKNIKNIILFYYMYGLLPQHRKVISLVETAKLLEENNIKGIFYFTPIDWETGEKYFPGEFAKRLNQNIQLIVSLMPKKGIELLNLSMDLKSDFFYWTLYPNEHMTQQGRLYVAEQLCNKIKNLL
jgi:hypothetical protein